MRDDLLRTLHAMTEPPRISTPDTPSWTPYRSKICSRTCRAWSTLAPAARRRDHAR
jgi:hypothetical protein